MQKSMLITTSNCNASPTTISKLKDNVLCPPFALIHIQKRFQKVRIALSIVA